MADKDITSRDNPAVKHFVQLAGSRRARTEQGLFVTESYKLTREAFLGGCAPVELFATEAALDRNFEELQDIALASEHFYHISAPVADKLSQSPSPQGVFGVFRMLDNGAQPVTISSNGRYLLLSSLQDPGNLGTILRTAAAFGADGVVLSDDCPDLYSLKVLRSAMGGVFRAKTLVTEDLGGFVEQLQKAGIAVYAAALHEEAVSIRDVSLKAGCAVVIGNEGGGLSPELIVRCGKTLTIPMEPGSESLNAAMAAGVTLWEMYR